MFSLKFNRDIRKTYVIVNDILQRLKTSTDPSGEQQFNLGVQHSPPTLEAVTQLSGTHDDKMPVVTAGPVMPYGEYSDVQDSPASTRSNVGDYDDVAMSKHSPKTGETKSRKSTRASSKRKSKNKYYESEMRPTRGSMRNSKRPSIKLPAPPSVPVANKPEDADAGSAANAEDNVYDEMEAMTDEKTGQVNLRQSMMESDFTPVNLKDLEAAYGYAVVQKPSKNKLIKDVTDETVIVENEMYGTSPTTAEPSTEHPLSAEPEKKTQTPSLLRHSPHLSERGPQEDPSRLSARRSQIPRLSAYDSRGSFKRSPKTTSQSEPSAGASRAPILSVIAGYESTRTEQDSPKLTRSETLRSQPVGAGCPQNISPKLSRYNSSPAGQNSSQQSGYDSNDDMFDADYAHINETPRGNPAKLEATKKPPEKQNLATEEDDYDADYAQLDN